MAVAAVLLAATASSPAGADAHRCDGDSASSLTVFCERSGQAPPRRRGHRTPATSLEVSLLLAGEGARGCTTGAGDDGSLFRHVRTTRDDRVVSDRLVCHSLSTPPGSGPSGSLLTWYAEQLGSVEAWPSGTIGITPDGRGLVAYPFGFWVDIAEQVTAGPVVLSDGTTGTAVARPVAFSWWVDDELVASTSGSGTSDSPALGYAWATSGAKRLEVVATWEPVLSAVYPDGTSELIELDAVDVVAAAALTVEAIQAVIEYER